MEFSLPKWSPPLKNNSQPSSPINKTNFSHPFRLTHTHMRFQVISGYLKDVCMPDAFKFCQSQPSSLVLVASERWQENSAWNSEDKQGLLPGRVVSLKQCWLLLHLIQRLSSETWGKLAWREISKTLLLFCLFSQNSLNKYC